MKRFWDQVSLEEADGGYAVLLDRKPMHLPTGAPLRLWRRRLAEAIAEEWQQAGGGKGGEISFADTPLTRVAGTVQHRIAPDPRPTIDAITKYGETDLLCYRAEAPANLVHRQTQAWQPWLDWAALTYDAPLRVTTGLRHMPQNPDSIRALHAAVAAFDPDALGGLGIAVPALGSLVLGLALAAGRLDPTTAHELGCLDELFQAELWGEDAEAAARRASVGQDVSLAARYIALTREEAV